MRFIVADEQRVSLSELEAALKETDAAYLIERDEESDDEGVLTYKGEVYGQIEVNREKIDPLWEWLLAHRKGLMQAEGEGYYDASGLILEVE